MTPPRAITAAAFCVTMLFGSECIKTPDPASYVTGVRVLAVKAQPPEAQPGQSSTLTALAVDTQGRMININWETCLDTPLQGQLVNPDCFVSGPADYLQPVGSGLQVMVTMPMVTPLQLGLPDETGGFYLPILGLTTAGTDSLTAVYRLRLGIQGIPPNNNPTISGLFQVPPAPDGGPGGQAVPLDPMNPPVLHSGDVITLRATFTPDSIETYEIPGQGPDGGPSQPRMVTETLSLSWFATAGTLSAGTTGAILPDEVLTMDSDHLPASGSVIDLWVVLRDERGGTDYQHGTLTYQ